MGTIFYAGVNIAWCFSFFFSFITFFIGYILMLSLPSSTPSRVAPILPTPPPPPSMSPYPTFLLYKTDAAAE